MIHRLEIENFYSIRETQVIDLRVGEKSADGDGRFALAGTGDRISKVVAFYGANASGKSNVLRALAFLRWFLAVSVQLPPDAPVPALRFADGNQDPVRLRVHFDWFSELRDATGEAHNKTSIARYSYEVRLGDLPGKPMAVLSEELRLHPAKGKSSKIFERSPSGKVEGGTSFPLTGLSHILDKMRPNVSTTSTIAQFAEHGPTNVLLAWARRIFPNMFWEKGPGVEQSALAIYHSQPGLTESVNAILGRVDLGIQSMQIAQRIGGIEAYFQHSGLNVPLPLSLESEGTRQFFMVYPYLWDTLRAGGIAVLDEFDSTIHPMLLPEILRWFYDPIQNPRHAQLWFSGHSASLLEELQKEEVFFTEKDAKGRTSVYGLKDIQSVRRSDNFYQKYLGGVYGAVPRIG